ncbi:hypothetical protein BC941DRAFT_465447 [Chlamydoabsidia padenii]|nr:hypothetical protein BC941DRAFT_465447 [Chlamydoabsidia padenii]
MPEYWADLVCPTAPYPVLPVDHSSEDATKLLSITEAQLSYSWLNPRRLNKSFSIKDSIDTDNETWKILKKPLIEEGPFDGVFGFSQGGSFSAMLSILLESHQFMPNPLGPDRIHPPLKMAILCGLGELDVVVNKENMLELAALYDNPVVVQHPGGHFVPSVTFFKKALTSFLLRLID